jgi:hypothetical protein
MKYTELYKKRKSGELTGDGPFEYVVDDRQPIVVRTISGKDLDSAIALNEKAYGKLNKNVIED